MKRSEINPLPITTPKAAPAAKKSLRYSIDKVNLSATTVIPMIDLITYWKHMNFQYENKKLKGNQECVICNGFIFLYNSNDHDSFKELITNPNHSPSYDNYINNSKVKDSFRKLITNPNHYPSYDDYIEKFKYTIPREYRSYLKMIRVDFPCDFINCSFQEVREKLLVDGVQLVSRYQSKSGLEETVYLGKPPKQYDLYDRNKKLIASGVTELEFSELTRFEICLYGKDALPTQNIFNLKEILLSGEFNPFKRINYYHKCKPVIVDKDEGFETIVKKVKLNTLLTFNGLQHTKNALKKSRHFNRDYGELLNLNDSKSLSTYYTKGISKYLNKPLVDGGFYE